MKKKIGGFGEGKRELFSLSKIPLTNKKKRRRVLVFNPPRGAHNTYFKTLSTNKKRAF